MDYVTIANVELVTVGMNWPASTGPLTLTLEHLVDAMVAANADPHVRRPRIKLGHSRLQPTDDGMTTLGDHDPFWDGEPAFGTADNLRLGNDGAVLIGDLIEVPDWLADAAPSAWPNRSCEMQGPVQTEGGKRYSMVITSVSLLGTVEHAIKDLADLRRLLADGPQEEI